jgi:hypothetical protein
LLFELPAGAVVAGDVTALLRAQGQTCNDIGLAVLGAQLGFAHSAETLWRCQDLIDKDDSLGYPIEEYHIACRDHVERLTAVYARAAAQYAVCVVQIASRVADGAPAAVPEPLPVLPSEVLLLAQIHVPLLEIRPRGHQAGAEPTGAGKRLPRGGSSSAGQGDGVGGEPTDHVRRAWQGRRATDRVPAGGRVSVRVAPVRDGVRVRAGDDVCTGRLIAPVPGSRVLLLVEGSTMTLRAERTARASPRSC